MTGFSLFRLLHGNTFDFDDAQIVFMYISYWAVVKIVKK